MFVAVGVAVVADKPVFSKVRGASQINLTRYNIALRFPRMSAQCLHAELMRRIQNLITGRKYGWTDWQF